MGRTFGYALLVGAAATILIGLFMANEADSDLQRIIGRAICTGMVALVVGGLCLLAVTVFREIAEGYGKIFHRLATG